MKIYYFFKKFLCLIFYIIKTKKILKKYFSHGTSEISREQSQVIKQWFLGIRDIIGVHVNIENKSKINDKNFLILSNHISWLDIIILGSIFETTFLSKSEVASWPVIGHITKSVDVLFIKRGSKDAAKQAIEMVQRSLMKNRNVVIFPEGTTSDGSSLLKFKPRLLASAIDISVPVKCVTITYPLENKINPVVPFVRSDSLFLSIIKILYSNKISVKIIIEELIETKGLDRKTLSNICFDKIKSNLNYY